MLIAPNMVYVVSMDAQIHVIRNQKYRQILNQEHKAKVRCVEPVSTPKQIMLVGNVWMV
jgi:hypothetical protein